MACSLRGLAVSTEVEAASARGLIGWVNKLGYRAIALDSTHPELRARSLDRSARRDLAASLKRSQLCLSGVDVFVPAKHFADRENADRATAAVLGAIELARELGSLGAGSEAVVCFELPDEPVEGVESEIVADAERFGVSVAVVRRDVKGLGRAVDIDALHDAGVEPAERIAEGCAQIRWGGPRPDRRVELMPIAGAFAMSGGGSCVVDLSHGRDVRATGERALEAWSKLAMFG
ncbi:MAG: hypothetical protein Phyf2KO_07710 [Phycisphaerales bacterium]